MVAIFILGVSLLGALACVVGLKYFLFHYDTKRIEYSPMDNSLQAEEPKDDIPPKYEEINLAD
jgi:hypothetical protein